MAAVFQQKSSPLQFRKFLGKGKPTWIRLAEGVLKKAGAIIPQKKNSLMMMPKNRKLKQGLRPPVDKTVADEIQQNGGKPIAAGQNERLLRTDQPKALWGKWNNFPHRAPDAGGELVRIENRTGAAARCECGKKFAVFQPAKFAKRLAKLPGRKILRKKFFAQCPAQLGIVRQKCHKHPFSLIYFCEN